MSQGRHHCCQVIYFRSNMERSSALTFFPYQITTKKENTKLFAPEKYLLINSTTKKNVNSVD